MLNLELLANRRARRNRNNAIRAGQMGTMMQSPASPVVDPLFYQDIASNIGAVGRGAKNLPVFLAGGLGDLAYMAVNPFMELAGQGVPAEKSFMTSDYLSQIPAVKSYLGEQEDSLPFLAGKYLSPLGAAKIPDAVELAMKGAMKAAPVINNLIDQSLTEPSALEGLLGITKADKLDQQQSLGLLDSALMTGVASDPRANVMMAAVPETTIPKTFSDPDSMGFRSTVEDVVNLDTFPNRGSAEQMEAALGQKGGLSKPVTAQLGNRKIDKEELKFLGITDVLEEAKRTGQPVTKEQIQNAIKSNRSNMYLEQEVLENIPSEPNLRDEVLSYEDSYGQEYINDEIDYILTDYEDYAKRLADNPDDEDAIRDEIYNMLEENYNYEPTQRIRLLDDGGNETDIYAIGSDDMGWTIRRGGDNWGDSDTLTQNRTFETVTNRNIDPMEINSENEARVQLEQIAFDEGYSGEGTKHRNDVAEDYGMGNIGDIQEYREIVVRSPETAGGDIGSHYGDDVAYHMRVSDREYRQEDGMSGIMRREDALYVDELQSDYAQAGAGRKMRLTKDEKTVLDNLDIDAKTKNLAFSNFDNPETDLAKIKFRKALDDYINANQLRSRGRISQTSEFKKQVSRAVASLAKRTRYFVPLKEQPLVAGQEKWVQHAVKNLITEMVETGKDRVIFTSGKNQADYWNEEGLEKFYDVRLKKEVEKVLKGIDKDAFEMVEGGYDYAGTGGTGMVGKEPLKHISIKNTQKIRDFLEGVGGKPKGFGMYSAAPVAVGAGLLSGQQEDNNATTSGAGLLGVR